MTPTSNAAWATEGKSGDIAMNRLGAAGALAASAAAGDTGYRPLADAMKQAQLQLSVTLDIRHAKVRASLDKARRFCKDL